MAVLNNIIMFFITYIGTYLSKNVFKKIQIGTNINYNYFWIVFVKPVFCMHINYNF